MSKFSGPQFKGAARAMRETKRAEAEERDLLSAHSWQGRQAREGDLDPAIYSTGFGLTGVLQSFRKPVTR